MTSIKGYTTPTADQIEMVNANKENEEQMLRMFDVLLSESTVCDKRWLSIAKTHFEEGFMALNRSIMNPKRLTDGEL